ncbi:ABC transporter ATP-binding protein [Lysinibacillus fusiformis]|uniref:ABC transporter ATP-binding protein n=1 Tax=Lysinibacillus fusiformis TaxID=28031 RepID=UPI003B9E3682
MDLKVQNIDVHIKKNKIIKDISLKVKDKQFVGIIGPNGCGKSTFLKSIYKSIKPSNGTAILGDINILKSSEQKVAKNLGVVGQFNEMSFDLTVQQMVMLGRTPHKKLLEPDNEEDHLIVKEALKHTNLLEFTNRSYLSLSGGEKQRVVLARTIAQQPQFMILDEPTNHLDIRYQIEILSCVKSLNIGVLAALHDLELSAHYCDYIYAIKEGKVYAHGTPENVLTSDVIEALYGVKCQTFKNPITHELAFAYIYKE